MISGSSPAVKLRMMSYSVPGPVRIRKPPTLTRARQTGLKRVAVACGIVCGVSTPPVPGDSAGSTVIVRWAGTPTIWPLYACTASTTVPGRSGV